MPNCWPIVRYCSTVNATRRRLSLARTTPRVRLRAAAPAPPVTIARPRFTVLMLAEKAEQFESWQAVTICRAIGCWQTRLPGFSQYRPDHQQRLRLPPRCTPPAAVCRRQLARGLRSSSGRAHRLPRCQKPLPRNQSNAEAGREIFRMVVPDLEIFLRMYSRNERDELLSLYPEWAMKDLKLIVKTPLEMIDYVFRDNQHNRHLSSWDFERAEFRLHEGGFSKVLRQSVNASCDPNLSGLDNQTWAQCSLYVEAIK